MDAIGFPQAGRRFGLAGKAMNIGRLVAQPNACGSSVAGGATRAQKAGGAAAQFHDVTRTLLAQDLLHALDGETIAVEQRSYASQQIEIVGTVIAPAAAALQRLDGRELRLPKTQHMLRHVEIGGNFADGPKRFRRFLRRTQYGHSLSPRRATLRFPAR